jgi:hemolysin III
MTNLAASPTGTERRQGFGEEIANSISNGIGLVAAIIGLPFLVIATKRSSAVSMVGSMVFAGTMILLYLTSTLYHSLPPGRSKRVFQKIDHGAIYLFIAGTYTPFALGALRGPWGWTLFGTVWSLAAVGVTLKSLERLSHPWLSTGLYLGMGWLVLIAVVPLVQHVEMAGILWLVAGGLAYTAGVAFYVLDSRFRYAHALWHGFVVAGSVCHFFAVLGYAA